MCEFCNWNTNDFVILNDTADYSGIEFAIHKKGMLRARYFENGTKDLFISQDMINIKYCPMCGKELIP